MEGYDIFVPEMKLDSKYSVSGAECQVLSVALKPGDTVQSEPGAMMVSSVWSLSPLILSNFCHLYLMVGIYIPSDDEPIYQDGCQLWSSHSSMHRRELLCDYIRKQWKRRWVRRN